MLLSGEETNTNFIAFDYTRSGLEPTIYHTPGEHANHYTTDVGGTEMTNNYKIIFLMCRYRTVLKSKFLFISNRKSVIKHKNVVQIMNKIYIIFIELCMKMSV